MAFWTCQLNHHTCSRVMFSTMLFLVIIVPFCRFKQSLQNHSTGKCELELKLGAPWPDAKQPKKKKKITFGNSVFVVWTQISKKDREITIQSFDFYNKIYVFVFLSKLPKSHRIETDTIAKWGRQKEGSFSCWTLTMIQDIVLGFISTSSLNS